MATRDQVELPVLQAQQVLAEQPEVVVVKDYLELAATPDQVEWLDPPEQRAGQEAKVCPV